MTLRVLRRGAGRVIAGLLGAALFFSLVAAAYWYSSGGRGFITATSSMGQELTVGTLVLTKPVQLEDLQVGDIITFREPHSGRVYTHRVDGLMDHAVTTRGDVNEAPDAWVITQSELVGEVQASIPAVGFLVRALPLLFIGWLLLWVITARLKPLWRYHYRFVGLFAVVAVVNAFIRPWVGLEKIAESRPESGDGELLMRVISTGLVPIKAKESGGDAAVPLVDGQVATLHLTHASDKGIFSVVTQLDLNVFWWVFLGLFCLSPLIYVMMFGLVDRSELELPEELVYEDPALASV